VHEIRCEANTRDHCQRTYSPSALRFILLKNPTNAPADEDRNRFVGDIGTVGASLVVSSMESRGSAVVSDASYYDECLLPAGNYKQDRKANLIVTRRLRMAREWCWPRRFMLFFLTACHLFACFGCLLR
jgi:hypothetical protein